MCMEDIRIGRKSYSGYHTANLINGSTRQLWLADKNRTRVTIIPDSANSVRIGPAVDPPTTSTGLTVLNTGMPVILRIEDVGPIIQEAWVGITVIGTANVAVLDTGLTDK